MTEQNSQALEQQIAELQKQLDAVRQQSGQDAAAPYERQEVHDQLQAQIKGQMESLSTTPTVPVPSGSTSSDTPSYQDPALAPQVQDLVNVAFTQGVQVAIDRAVRTGNAALIDALHDVLADQLHEELLKRQKIPPAA